MAPAWGITDEGRADDVDFATASDAASSSSLESLESGSLKLLFAFCCFC